jgi:hypothetical protein
MVPFVGAIGVACHHRLGHGPGLKFNQYYSPIFNTNSPVPPNPNLTPLTHEVELKPVPDLDHCVWIVVHGGQAPVAGITALGGVGHQLVGRHVCSGEFYTGHLKSRSASTMEIKQASNGPKWKVSLHVLYFSLFSRPAWLVKDTLRSSTTPSATRALAIIA